MRILHVVPSYIPAWRYGGTIHSVHGLCSALAGRGHEVVVATTNVDGEDDSDVPLGVPVELDRVQVRYFPSTRLRRLYYSPPMYRFLNGSMPGWDLVHTHSVFLWPTSAASHVARRVGKPYVLSPRGMLVQDLISRRSSIVKKAWIRLIERRNVAGAAAVHVTSAVEASELQALGLRPRRLIEVPNGLDRSWMESAQPVAAEDASLPSGYVLYLGRISWKKGIDRLLDCLVHAPGAMLVVAGNDEEEYWPRMARKARELSISDRVRYVGFVEGERKRALLSGAAVLALTSYSENFGNVVLEAMAMGVPVLVTPEVGLAPTVARTESGVVAEGDSAVLGQALASLLGDKPLRERLGANGRATARTLSWDGIAARFEDLYGQLLQ